jgi:hypothetical protein
VDELHGLRVLEEIPPCRFEQKKSVGNDGTIRLELKPSVSSAVIRDVRNSGGSTVTVPDEITNELTTNVIVRDGGIAGVVVRLGPAFGKVATDGLRVTAGAAALDSRVSFAAANAGIAGMEFFSGVPGTIGGALRMNAGCYGRETKDVLVSARGVNRRGERVGFGRRLTHAHRALRVEVAHQRLHMPAQQLNE